MGRILIVEDDPMISEIYQKKFSEAGFVLDTVSSGKDVLPKMKANPPELVLLDLVMPEIDGFEVLKMIRKDSGFENVKVIIFSNLSQQEDKDKAFKLGANGFLSKTDYEPSEMVAEVKRIIEQSEEEEKAEEFRKKGGNEEVENAEKKKVLMIEDEEVFIEMFGRKLEEENLELKIAKNGAWGVKEAKKQKFDLIVMDMVMPAMNGVEMLEAIRTGSVNEETPVVVLSGSASDEERRKVLQLGAQEYLVKTHVTPSELVKSVKKLI